MRRLVLAFLAENDIFLEYESSTLPGAVGLSNLATAAHSSIAKDPKPVASQLFDILPIQGLLQPGQMEQVEFTFYAYPGVKTTALAECSVVDGPVYQV